MYLKNASALRKKKDEPATNHGSNATTKHCAKNDVRTKTMPVQELISLEEVMSRATSEKRLTRERSRIEGEFRRRHAAPKTYRRQHAEEVAAQKFAERTMNLIRASR